MSAPVFLAPHASPSLHLTSAGSTVRVSGPEAHHAVVVQRLRTGEAIELVDGAGWRARGTVSAQSMKDELVIQVEDVIHDAPSTTRIVVVQALPKGERGERAVELLTEVGVDVIIPWASDHTIAEWKGERAVKAHAKWVATANAATKQSRRSYLPAIEELHSTAQLLEGLARQSFVLDEQAHVSARGAWSDLGSPEEVWVIVGPEGGLSQRERELFDEKGVPRVRLELPVMRTSTAGSAAVITLRTLLEQL